MLSLLTVEKRRFFDDGVRIGVRRCPAQAGRSPDATRRTPFRRAYSRRRAAIGGTRAPVRCLQGGTCPPCKLISFTIFTFLTDWSESVWLSLFYILHRPKTALLPNQSRSISAPADNFRLFSGKVPHTEPNRLKSWYTNAFYSYGSRENIVYGRSNPPKPPARSADL